MTDKKLNERVLPDDYPIYDGYAYICDGKITFAPKGDISVTGLKRILGVKEVKNCDMVGRNLFD